MIRIIILVLLLIGDISLNSQIIPQDRLVDWNKAGLEYNLNFSAFRKINAIDIGLDNTGKTDNSKKLNDFIQSSKDSIIILFSKGEYLFNSTISLRSGLILKGEGYEATIFKFDLGKTASNCINITGSLSSQEIFVDSGYVFNSDKLYANNKQSLKSGDYVDFYQTNGSWDAVPADWAKNSVGQILKINSINGDIISLNQKLRISYTDSLKPRLRVFNSVQNSGIECLKIKRIDEPASGAGYNIFIYYAVNCYVRGIYSDKSVGAHVMIDASSNCTLSDSYITDAFTFDGTGTRGYGVTLNSRAGLNLIENNIFKRLRHAMMTKHGANGNVFAYNYSTEVNRSEPISGFSGDISLHGHYSYANLFEGNIVQNIIIDRYWGPSGPLNTFHRNRCLGYGIIITSGTDGGVTTAKQSFIANEVDYSGLLLGPYNIIGANHFEYGNNINGKILPNADDKPDINSLYYKTIPNYFGKSYKFPPIGPNNALSANDNPALQRYKSGNNLAICERTINEVNNNTEFSNLFYINGDKLINKSNANLSLKIFDYSGKLIYEISANDSVIELNFLTSGIYLINIKTQFQEYNLKYNHSK